MSQKSFTGQKGHRNECRDAQRAIGDRGTLNSAPNVQTGQNRRSRRRVTRAFVHTTHGDIRLIQILVIQAFQIYKLIGHRRSDTSSIKFQAFSGFSLNRTGPTAQPSQAEPSSHGSTPSRGSNPRLRHDSPKPRFLPPTGGSKPPPPQIQIFPHIHQFPSPIHHSITSLLLPLHSTRHKSFPNLPSNFGSPLLSL
ncbi:hypothetical protein CRG98_012397 [Punica granatum]|uniref:Uncharacterized protein n=1 Tax=Punica granatum TaxID=22663 RepID=A0A2I0KFW3_PUNGR|nr:hypothetical protein CRG98_012397 [Punica granatum]